MDENVVRQIGTYTRWNDEEFTLFRRLIQKICKRIQKSNNSRGYEKCR